MEKHYIMSDLDDDKVNSPIVKSKSCAKNRKNIKLITIDK
jgi:hypothetical protein